jgi:hypothetical protein
MCSEAAEIGITMATDERDVTLEVDEAWNGSALEHGTCPHHYFQLLWITIIA